jgi:caffeoyl-CoA O-methyltransferase
MEINNPQIFDYAIKNSTPQPALLDELIQYTAKYFPQSIQMLSGPLEGRFLNFLVSMTRAQNILELGTFTGFSALSMAEALPENGKLITCEIDERVMTIAKEFAARCDYGHKIDFRLGSGLAILDTLENQKFDLIFIDADKMAYPDYVEKALHLVSSQGLIVLDNTLWGGDVLDPQEKRATMFVELNKKLANDPRLQVIQLPIRDGITLIRKFRQE